jgi:hypothetical protein
MEVHLDKQDIEVLLSALDRVSVRGVEGMRIVIAISGKLHAVLESEESTREEGC